jgi:xanthine dehydrogenase accessory factor
MMGTAGGGAFCGALVLTFLGDFKYKGWSVILGAFAFCGVSVAVVTRGHNEDEECLRAVVASRPDYVGLIGSRRRTNIVLDRLREAGADEDQLNDVRAPIGLDIGAVSPEEVALAILAEIVATRRGGTGQPLRARRKADVKGRGKGKG